MFTGIVETVGEVIERQNEGSNVHFQIRSSISAATNRDNSVSHNGVCLTVTRVENECHWVTAVLETLQLTNLAELERGSAVNLERAMRADSRLEGHLVQGHVDATAVCKKVVEAGGSRYITFALSKPSRLLVHKGSVCVNGVSLTVIEPTDTAFTVAIVPYTFEHTTFKQLDVDHRVNIEFDIVGKYLERWALPFLNNTNVSTLKPAG